MYRSQSPRGNQRNWNGQKSNQLGKDFMTYNKACFICGSFNHLQINCDNHQRRSIVSRNNYNRVDAKTTHPNVLRNMSPKTIMLKTGLTQLNTVRPVNTARPKTAIHSANSKTHFSKQAQTTAKRPFYKQTSLTRRFVHVLKRHYYTGRPKAVNTARTDSSVVSNKVFEGKVVLFGGNFRQILPVITNSDMGNGKSGGTNDGQSNVVFPDDMLIQETDDDVGDEKEYESSDSVCLANEDSNFDDSIYTIEFLNGLCVTTVLSADMGNGKSGGTNDGQSNVVFPDDMLIQETNDDVGAIIDDTYPDMLRNLSFFFSGKSNPCSNL
ncbi:hypothetical protein Tco_1300213 [Tanacetum coccineum]